MSRCLDKLKCDTLDVNSLEKILLRTGSWVTHSHYGTRECGGVPKATVGEFTSTLATLTSTVEGAGTSAKAGEVGKKFVFYILVLGLLLEERQGEVSLVTAPRYT